MKVYYSKFGTYLLYYIAAIWVGMIAVMLSVIPLRLISSTSLLTERLFESIAQFISSAIFLFVMMKKLGYKNGKSDFKKTIICTGTVFILQQIITFGITHIFNTDAYLPHFTGGASTLAKAVFLGDAEAMKLDVVVQGVPVWSYHLFMLLLCTLIYIPAMIYGERCGAKKRTSERKDLGLEND